MTPMPDATEFWCFWPPNESESGWNFLGDSCPPPLPAPHLGGFAPQTPQCGTQKSHHSTKWAGKVERPPSTFTTQHGDEQVQDLIEDRSLVLVWWCHHPCLREEYSPTLCISSMWCNVRCRSSKLRGFLAFLALRCVFWVPHWRGWGAKISATFTFIWWSKTSKFSCIRHRGHIN